jgi:DNA-binding GntR family transcriptional regulator
MYRAVVDAIRQKILSGEWPPGTKLPTKKQLAEEYESSTQVIDVAMVVLRTEGWVEGQQGKGVYVAARPEKEGTT